MKRENLTPSRAVDLCLEMISGAGVSRLEVDRSADRLLRLLESEYDRMPEPGKSAWQQNRIPFRIGWAAVAGVVVLMMAGALLRVDTRAIGKVEAGSVTALGGSVAIDVLKTKQRVRAGGSGATVSLGDGSRVELQANSTFSIAHKGPGIEVQLEAGNVLVTAAPQRDRHLSVLTPDSIVSVTGTVFSVRAEQAGSRVSVYEGEVKLSQGNRSYTLTRGEQMATSPILGVSSMETEIQWSRNASMVLALLQPSQSVEVQPGEESIEGILKDATTGRPLAGATIVLAQPMSDSRTAVAETKSGTDGRFKISKVVPGAYELVASLAGYWAPDPPGLPVKVAPGQSVTNIVLRLIQGATLQGRLTDINGEPMVYVIPELVRVQGGRFPLPKTVDGKRPNQRGEYEFAGVLPGKYYLQIPRGNPVRPRNIYYPGTANPEDAIAIDLQPGTITRGIDFGMVSVEVYAVRFGAPKNTLLWLDVISQLTSLRGVGTGVYLPMNVRGPSSKVPANPRFVSLRLQPLRESSVPLVGIGQAPGDYAVLGNDKYLIPSVPPGKYRLEVSWAGESEIQPDGTQIEPRATVQEEIEVIDRNMDLGNLASRPRNLSVPVHFTFVNGRELHVTVSTFSGAAPVAVNSLSATRPLRLNYLGEGSHSLMFTPPPDHYVSIARYGSQDVLRQPMVLDGVDRGVLEIVVEKGAAGGSLKGTVRNASGQAVPNARVVLYQGTWIRGQGGVWSSTTDKEGKFQFGNRPPGDYHLFSWEFLPPETYTSFDWLSEYSTRGTPVSIRKGETINIDVSQILAKH